MGFRGNVHIRMHAIVNVPNRNVYIYITLIYRIFLLRKILMLYSVNRTCLVV